MVAITGVLGHVQRDDSSRMYNLIFTENTLTSVETGEAVVSRDDDAGSCSQAQSSVEDALYGVVVCERQGVDQPVHAPKSPTHAFIFSPSSCNIRRCVAETAPEPRFTMVDGGSAGAMAAALERRCAPTAVAATAPISCGRTSS